MLSSLLVLMSVASAITFLYMKAPLPMAAMIILQAFLISFSTYLVSNEPWFSFILFMIFLSAMMIIFIYISSLAPNETLMIKTPSNMLLALLVLLFITSMLLVYTLDWSMLASHSTLPITPIDSSVMACYKIYTPEVSAMTLFLIVYLFICLLVVVKNAINHTGPLRIKK